MANLTSIAIKRAQAQIDPRQLEQAAQRLLDAKRLFFFGRGDSQIRARSFQNKLIKLDIFPVIAEEYVDEKWVVSNIHKTDCVLFISYGANIPEYTQIMAFLEKKQVPTILLTGNRQIKVRTKNKLTIVSTQDENENESKIGTFASQIAFEYILDTLFSIMYGHAYTKNLLNQRQTQELLNTDDLF
ncbi:MurR/RpiR family transcriptional regulator [Pediococcus parvulus]|nr:SIS domain-containing protein [Pediococcus parvulus]